MIVVGCGVSGLSCAAVLAEAGHAVEIWARELPPQTTSNVAAAFWYPYRADPPDRVTRWARLAYERFAALADDPRAGITMRHAYDLYRAPVGRPWWASAVPTLRQATADELPPGFAFAWVFEAPVIDTRRYLPWLVRRVEDLGVRIRRVALGSLDEALAHADTVIDCAGLGARELAPDPGVFPIRGQLLHVADPGIDRVVLDEHEPGEIAYVVPRGDDCVLGGTAGEHEDDLDVRPDEADRILAGCVALEPALAGARRLADVVGLRPGRATVRLESERRDGKLVVHDYGHGGAGITLSWGCALEVLEHVQAAARSAARP